MLLRHTTTTTTTSTTTTTNDAATTTTIPPTHTLETTTYLVQTLGKAERVDLPSFLEPSIVEPSKFPPSLETSTAVRFFFCLFFVFPVAIFVTFGKGGIVIVVEGKVGIVAAGVFEGISNGIAVLHITAWGGFS